MRHWLLKSFTILGSLGILFAWGAPYANAAATASATTQATTACDNLVDSRHPVTTVSGVPGGIPDLNMTLQMRVDHCEGVSYIRIINSKAVGRSSCRVNFMVAILGVNHLVQPHGCPAAGTSVSSVKDGNSTARLHWASLSETIGGRIYTVCVDERGEGICR